MAHLIETYADRNRGDYLIHHWLRSLRDNVDLHDLDILVFDYGLTEGQAKQLRGLGVTVQQGLRNGRMSNIHYRDLAEYLRIHEYDQVLYADCGDIIFQADIRDLFELHKERYRGVCEGILNLRMHRWTLGFGDLKNDSHGQIKSVLRGRPIINGGFVLAPASKLRWFWDEYQKLCRAQLRHGTDQLIMSYVMYRDGFTALPEKYNFVLITTKSKFAIRQSRFFDADGAIIPVVHNAGRYDWARSISQFGYGPGMNGHKRATHWCMSAFYSSLNWLARSLPE